MIFGQLLERSMKIFFLKNHTQNAMEKYYSQTLKNRNWAYLWINILKFHTACFYGMSSWGVSEHIKTKLQTTAFTSYKAFLKNKMSGTSLPTSFSVLFFEKKYFSCYILLPDQIS